MREEKNLRKRFADELAAKGGMCLPAAYAVGYSDGRYELRCDYNVPGTYRMHLLDDREHVKELPYIDVDDLYEACGGRFVTPIVCEYLKDFIERYEEALENETVELEQMQFLLKDFPARKIFMAMLPYQRGKSEYFPGRICGNAYMIYGMMVDYDKKQEDYMQSMIITQELMKKWQKNETDLFEAALKVMPGFLPYSIERVQGILGMDGYVISTELGCFGTGTLFYEEGPLKDLALELSSNLYVIPLSVHEAAAFPETYWVPESEWERLAKEISPFGEEVWYYDRFLNDLAFTKWERIDQKLKLKDGILDVVERRELDANVR